VHSREQRNLRERLEPDEHEHEHDLDDERRREASTSTPSPVSISPIAGPATKFAIAAAKHGTSLAQTGRQRYVVTCSATTSVQLRVGATVRAGKKRLALTARALTLKCSAGKPVEASASFKLNGAAKKLLALHGASVKLAVRAYASGTAAGTRLANTAVPRMD
jgi:hypothetical protein